MILERMALELGLSDAFVAKLVSSASHQYKSYAIPKRSGGTRQIHHPSRPLKSLQRWLLANVVENLTVHSAATAYRKSRSIMDNAVIHAESKFLLRMDFTKFFPSITRLDLTKYIGTQPAAFEGWSPRDIEGFCRLLCRKDRLTIGAPTSPAISNAICYQLDSRLQALAQPRDVRYSRYADDLFFSTRRRDVLGAIEALVRDAISELDLPAALTVNAEKTRHSSRRGTRVVTGIVLGSDGTAYIGRSRKRAIRSQIHSFDSLDESAQSALAGRVAFATGLDPNFKNSLILKFGPERIGQVMGAAGPK